MVHPSRQIRQRIRDGLNDLMGRHDAVIVDAGISAAVWPEARQDSVEDDHFDLGGPGVVGAEVPTRLLPIQCDNNVFR